MNRDTCKTTKISFINSGPVDIIRTVYYIHGAELMKLIFAERWALHVVIKRKYFYIYYITIIVYYAKRQQNTNLRKYNSAIFAHFVNWY